MSEQQGPTLEISEWVHSSKYRGRGESFKEAMSRVASSLQDSPEHYQQFRDILLDMRFMPAGRVQTAMGSPRLTTPYNCFVSGTIGDSMTDIMDKAKEAATTMRLGGGIGYDFSGLRPRGDHIRSLDSRSSGPISFMGIFDAVCGCVRSAGHRRGAQMGVLRVDHPDIEEFVDAKTNDHNLTNFNISVGVTDEFMEAVRDNKPFNLRFDGRNYRTISAVALWDKILRSTWEWAEPGILFIDRINRKNNLWYCENIAATNPCGEQPLPPYGACLLGSFNLTKYVVRNSWGTLVGHPHMDSWEFDYEQFRHDIPTVVRAMDNVVDRAIYPLPQQEQEAKNKRRMGLGVTGVANAIECLGFPYGSPEFLKELGHILSVLRDTAYTTSVSLALEKGPFPLYDGRLLESEFATTLPESIRELIKANGLRNSHLLSIAPTGTISLSADNVPSGIEPVFSLTGTRVIQTFDGPRVVEVSDFGYREWGLVGKTTDKVSVEEHVDVLTTASRYVDSACSKTCNVSNDVTWEEFKNVYMRAYEGGASGCTTFRAAGKRFGVLNAAADEEEVVVDGEEDRNPTEGSACYYDPETGLRACE
jgi:ribonucleoside-diphosphate reductase alpha chain